MFPSPLTVCSLTKSLQFFLPRKIWVLPLEPSLLPSFSGSLDCNIVIIYVTANIHLWVLMYHVSFLVWVTSLRMMFSSYIHLSSNFLMSLFNTQAIFHCTNIPHIFIYSSVKGHLGCFQVLTITNRVAIDITEYLFGMLDHPLGQNSLI